MSSTVYLRSSAYATAIYKNWIKTSKKSYELNIMVIWYNMIFRFYLFFYFHIIPLVLCWIKKVTLSLTEQQKFLWESLILFFFSDSIFIYSWTLPWKYIREKTGPISHRGRKWNRFAEFKTWTNLFAFHFAQMVFRREMDPYSPLAYR